jgi:hypothetical protein
VERESQARRDKKIGTLVDGSSNAKPIMGRRTIRDARFLRHCERSEAIQSCARVLDCFVATLLAMTIGRWLFDIMVGKTRARMRRENVSIFVIASEAKRSNPVLRCRPGLLRRFAPRNDRRNRWLLAMTTGIVGCLILAMTIGIVGYLALCSLRS